MAATAQWQLPAQPFASQQSAADREFFPVAVWYSGGKSRAPMTSLDPAQQRAAWRHDLQAIKATGFNTVKTWVDWSSAEPLEGQFHLAGLRQMLDLAHQTGLRVIVQIYADSAPDWVGRKYPDAAFVTSTGVQMPSESAPGYSFDNPGVRRAELGFYQAVAKICAASPAFYGYDLWSEPHLVNWASFRGLTEAQFGFNRYTQARFRRWLQKKYGSLAALNTAWYRTYTRWDEVSAPRLSTILSYTDFIDWEEFLWDKIAGDLRTKADAVHAVDPTHLASSHSDAPSVTHSPVRGKGDPDDWEMFPQVDYYGASFYPKLAGAVFGGWAPAFRGFAYDGSYAASEGKGFYVGELQAGQGISASRVNVPVTADDIRDWTWSLIAHGAKEIAYYAWYPMNAGYESGGYGFIHLDGTLTPRAQAGGEIARVVTAHAQLFHDVQPLPAQVAILYNPLSYLSGGGAPAQAQAARDSMLGIYESLFQQNIPVAFVHAHDVERGGLGRYRAVFLPYALTLSRAESQAIAAYVQSGGVAIAEARMGLNDEHGMAFDRTPGGGLDQVFGVREAGLQPGAKVSYRFAADAPDGLAGLSVPVAEFEEDLSLEHGHVLAHFPNGQPAVVASTFGKGRTIYVGSFLGMAAEQSPTEAAKAASQKAIQALARWAGLTPPVEITRSGGKLATGVEVRLLRDGARTVLIAINRGQPGTFDLQLPRAAGEAQNLLSGQPVAVSPGRRARIRLQLGNEGVAVVLVH